MSNKQPYFDKNGAANWYSKGHQGYFMKDFIGEDCRIDNIKDWVNTNIPKGGSIVDIGCGDMSLANLMPDHNWTGYDLDGKKDSRIVETNVSNTPYSCQGDSFDAVVCSEVLEHLFEPHVVISEFNRILKVGGHLIVTVPNFNSLDHLMERHSGLVFDITKFWTLEHIRWYTPECMAKMLVDRGFKIIDFVGNSLCFSEFMTPATCEIINYMQEKHGIALTRAQADQLHGRMYPFNCPGMGYLCRKV